MHIADILAAQPCTCSFEFFPPRTEQGAEMLYEALRSLESLDPSFVSVTYGAGGSSRQLTHDLVVRIQSTTRLTAIPHLTCVGHAESDIDGILQRYAEAGVNNVLALGGDLPASLPRHDRASDAFRYATDLVGFIRRFNTASRHAAAKGFGVGVAGYPEGHPATPNRLREMDYLKAKVDAGADYICTQLFFDNRDFFDFRERCELSGIDVPIIAGIMPLTTWKGMLRMAELAGGARFPAALLREAQRHADHPADVERIGVEWATRQCNELIREGTRGLHFYTLNKSRATRAVHAQLALPGRA
jgi:methylenetetrahydrofolate reductase (NADPH)